MATGQLLKVAEKCDNVCFAKLSFIFRYVQKFSRLTATIGSREVSRARLPLQRMAWFIGQVFKDFFLRTQVIRRSGFFPSYQMELMRVTITISNMSETVINSS